MKAIRLIPILFVCACAQAAHVRFNYSDFTTHPEDIKELRLYPLGAPFTNGAGVIIARDRVVARTGAGGSVTISNIYGGDYRSELFGTTSPQGPTVTTNWFHFPVTNGVINAADYAANLTNGPSGIVSYSTTQSDSLFVLKPGAADIWTSNASFIFPKDSSVFKLRLKDGTLFVGKNVATETDINNTNSISPLYQISMTDSNEPASVNLQFGVVDSHAHKFVAQSLWDHYASSNGSLVLLKLHAHDRTNSSEIGFISDSTGPAFYVRSNFVNLFAVSQNALSINGVDYVPPNSQGSAGSMLSDVSGSGILFWSQDASSLTNIILNISGSNAIAPADLSTIRAWVNVTLPNGAVFKMPLYQ